MKTIQTIILSILSMTLFSACIPSGDGAITVPFKANFYTDRNYDNTGEGVCTEDPYLGFNYQVGKGKATLLGSMDVTISFCGIEGTPFYKNGIGTFVAANGDKLYIKIPAEGEIGEVYPKENHELYELQFQDKFSFNGGTGRFAGATGEGYTDSFVDLLDDDGNFLPEHRTDHVWRGILKLPNK
ncbi:hypothetical protein [Hwangdonia seohaensis]|uniref:Lipoprotein n=1 Tax=Hwangdonia seohaensis TaxID=1240727 RepID=A0ABW3R7I3_9FLAO|nr:hypothetical protein [Hwangdonia seohaensis]